MFVDTKAIWQPPTIESAPWHSAVKYSLITHAIMVQLLRSLLQQINSIYGMCPISIITSSTVAQYNYQWGASIW